MKRKLTLTTSILSILFLAACNTTTETNSNTETSQLPQTVLDAVASPKNTLSQELLNTLSYMGNEERLAYDVYMRLYQSFPTQQTFYNIASKAESKHIETVQLLVKKYVSDLNQFTNTNKTVDSALNLDISYTDYNISQLPAGQYNVDAIQTLYNILTNKGLVSQRDALEVGCMVEVTDINDLVIDLALANKENASDIVTSFEFLRDGSYSHYWAFDKALQNTGVTDGCCSLGTIDGVNYCHPEYPQNNNQGKK